MTECTQKGGSTASLLCFANTPVLHSKTGSLGIAVMLGWIDKSSRQIEGKCKCISCMDGIWQSLVSRITGTPNKPLDCISIDEGSLGVAVMAARSGGMKRDKIKDKNAG